MIIKKLSYITFKIKIIIFYFKCYISFLWYKKKGRNSYFCIHKLQKYINLSYELLTSWLKKENNYVRIMEKWTFDCCRLGNIVVIISKRTNGWKSSVSITLITTTMWSCPPQPSMRKTKDEILFVVIRNIENFFEIMWLLNKKELRMEHSRSTYNFLRLIKIKIIIIISVEYKKE